MTFLLSLHYVTFLLTQHQHTYSHVVFIISSAWPFSDTNIESPESNLFFLVSAATLSSYLVFTYCSQVSLTCFLFVCLLRSPCTLYLSHRTMSSPSCICLLSAISSSADTEKYKMWAKSHRHSTVNYKHISM